MCLSLNDSQNRMLEWNRLEAIFHQRNHLPTIFHHSELLQRARRTPGSWLVFTFSFFASFSTASQIISVLLLNCFRHTSCKGNTTFKEQSDCSFKVIDAQLFPSHGLWFSDTCQGCLTCSRKHYEILLPQQGFEPRSLRWKSNMLTTTP